MNPTKTHTFFSMGDRMMEVSGSSMRRAGNKKTAEKKAKSINNVFLKVNKWRAARQKVVKEVTPNPKAALNRIFSMSEGLNHFFTMRNPLKKRSPKTSIPRNDEESTLTDNRTKGSAAECRRIETSPVKTG